MKRLTRNQTIEKKKGVEEAEKNKKGKLSARSPHGNANHTRNIDKEYSRNMWVSDKLTVTQDK